MFCTSSFFRTSLFHLLQFPTLEGLRFAKIDTQNCFFWSIFVYPNRSPVIFLTAGGSGAPVYESRKLPFGWAWSPLLAQLTIHDIISPVHSLFPSLWWQYTVPDKSFSHLWDTSFRHSPKKDRRTVLANEKCSTNNVLCNV